jgi:hypothetical protein
VSTIRQANFKPLVLLIVFLLLNGCEGVATTAKNSPSGNVAVKFPNGSVQFEMPEHYSQSAEPDDTIAITPGDETGIVLRFNLHNLPEAVAEEFLQSQATDKGLQMARIGGKAAFSETGTRSEAGRQYDMNFWQVGFEDALVVISAEVDREHQGNRAVNECLDVVPKIIESLQKY